MLPNAKYYDVWILKANQVIREVPIDTVLGWTNERRLVAKDKIRPAGTSDWFEVGELTSFSTPENQISSNETIVLIVPRVQLFQSIKKLMMILI